MLTFIIPVLNEAPNLERLLPRLVADCPGAEIIVVDGGSQDASREVARRHGARVLSGRRGRARQMNGGAGAATGDILVFLHADTALPAKAALAIEAALEDAEVVGGRFDVRLDSRRLLLRLVAALMNLRSRLTGIATGDQAIFVRQSVFASLGGYADIPLMEDVEFTRRLKRMGRLACLRLSVATSARKWEREGVLRTICLMWSLRFLYWLGVPPERLHRWYYPRRDPDISAP
ncbi:MAG TPA: TIGR04283 family arsenosugar biosynthesis glycosyltransferase [Candidatus Methylomirabilis sp.]|nr:TIGR04283 family arsenosugar biosynthesis glycosyltransferase [Candidatus Methylomirabilis sp.]